MIARALDRRATRDPELVKKDTFCYVVCATTEIVQTLQKRDSVPLPRPW